MADVVRHQRSAGSRRRAAVASRFWGLVVYAGLAAWCLWQLPSAAAFVVPAAFVGAVLHVGRGRPYLAVLAFVVIAAVAPPLLWPAMTTDVVDDVRSFVGR